ncbi:ferritin heavy polypeptide-like 17 [Mesocricetus auratus]|uniref:Ferritin n=1 Tax=Mesocricetus auratus TaxID=10036 RepID=A0ABM2WFM4_MESAU|nr:ferritin heavy polypeptide-like 17 [Mesocricetus auratus]XP_040589653.1 ferritin heavy polypeptide-like 17 [Mesocricetus auratus]XP_040589662.1 ferritin heavy polypeptide-like 17 [Mesocricetus auratus]XP_040589712.1 ferritin heavy polypeptide-like 17 [Mesocricetus auratus]
MAAAPSRVHQSYDLDCEDAINTHIQLEMYASYVYLSMAFHFDRDDMAQGNLKRFSLSKSHHHQACAEMFMALQNKCGGRIVLHNIARPDRDSWQGGIQAMECAFHMEMTTNQSLLNLHALAKGKGNAYLCDFLKQHCLDQQVQVLKEVSLYLTNLRQMGAPENRLAEYLFNKLSLS